MIISIEVEEIEWKKKNIIITQRGLHILISSAVNTPPPKATDDKKIVIILVLHF